MNPTDRKAFERTLRKVWPLKGINPIYWPILRKAMWKMWKECKEHYEKEYSIPKAEGRL